jgi:hypothetical protein
VKAAQNGVEMSPPGIVIKAGHARPTGLNDAARRPHGRGDVSRRHGIADRSGALSAAQQRRRTAS